MSLYSALYPVFLWVVSASLTASLVAGLILLLKAVLRDRLNARFHYLIWMIVLLRLILPWYPSSPLSIFNIISQTGLIPATLTANATAPASSVDKINIAQPALPKGALTDSNDPAAVIQQNNQKPEDTVPNLTAAQASQGKTKIGNLFENIKLQRIDYLELFFAVWLLGFLLSVSLLIILNLRFSLKLKANLIPAPLPFNSLWDTCKASLHVRKSLPAVLTSIVASPTLYGIFRPRLLINPSNLNTLNEEELYCVFFHELAHWKRKDILVNWLASLLLALHWFNPILWFAYYRLREDQEIACDAYALSYLNPGSSLEYARTVIKLLESINSRFLPDLAGISNPKIKLERRLHMIKGFSKSVYHKTLLGLVVLLCLFAVALTNAKANQPDKTQATGNNTHPGITSGLVVKVGANNDAQTVQSGSTISVSYGSGIIPVFVTLPQQNLGSVTAKASPSAWLIETKNNPTGDTAYFNVDIGNYVPQEGDITIEQITSADGTGLLSQPITFHLKVNYTLEDYHVSLTYPAGWKLNPKYYCRYDGKDGFINLSAVTGGQDSTLDKIVNNEVNHILHPYGSSPQIIKLQIQGQEARLILPSADQPPEIFIQAEIIVKYPQPVSIGRSTYSYFLLSGDEAHIKQIAESIRFTQNVQ